MLLALLLACPPDETEPQGPPYGMILRDDGIVYAGAARVDITPTITETYEDLNGNNQFDGCYTDPSGTRGGCDEPYDDANGDNHFDGTWIAGFQTKRAAQGVHDPLTVTAVVMSLDGEYVAIAGVDVIGVLENRVRDARDLLEADGFDRDRLVVSSSHAHSSADSVGIWGIDEDLISGAHEEFTSSITAAIHETVSAAASEMVAVSPTVGISSFDDPEFNGAPFGGTNPDASVVQGINDIRDPLIPAGEVLAIALDGDEGRVATIVNASGHPEVSGSDHSQLSADYPGVVRDYIDGSAGGTTLFVSGALGGMQSALGAPIPAVDASGARVLDENGDPTWLTESNFDFVYAWGVHIAQAAERALTDTQAWDQISVKHSEYLIPVDNTSFKLAFQIGLLDTPDEYVDQSSDCPGYGTNPDNFGCVPGASSVLRLGPVTFGAVPGELFPELFYGVPDEPAMADSTLRQGDKRWVQGDPDCAGIDWGSECVDTDEVDGNGCTDSGCDGKCDCLNHHAEPYRASDEHPRTIAEMLPGTYKAPLGITNAYCGYIVPTPDFSTYVSVLTDDGDHYEETNSCSQSFGDLVLGGFADLAE
ncbi:MAG: hypothetical protein FJ102_10160 [Deltaproteobacteria bacterium]|nr:hypothetical protein [Deltaproteobacteria bacterium]